MIRAVLLLLLLAFALLAGASYAVGYFHTRGEMRASEIEILPCPAPPAETWRRA